MQQFSDGMKVSKIQLTNGSILIVDDKPIIATGFVESLTIVMQPSHGGLAPWVNVVWGEKDTFGNTSPDTLYNLAAVQSVEIENE